VRARLLLHKQDSVSLLEDRLRAIDETEPRVLFLGSMRRDRNPERIQALKELDVALADYGKYEMEFYSIFGD
jgi:hypothetical protein